MGRRREVMDSKHRGTKVKPERTVFCSGPVSPVTPQSHPALPLMSSSHGFTKLGERVGE